VGATLSLIHDSHGDTCEAYFTETLLFDLTPLADFYQDGYLTNGGVVDTNYGLYAFGELSCEDRENAARSRVGDASEQADRSCQSADDCVLASIDTRCSASCGAVVSSTGEDQLNAARDSINSTICGDYAGDCGPLIVPPCDPPLPIDCVDGLCTEVEP